MVTTKKLSSLFCFSFLFHLLFTINQTISEPDHMETICIKPLGNFTRSKTYNTILSTFRKKSSTVNYYNLTTGLAPDTVHGMFLCTGDVNITTCNTCIKNATIEIAKNCTNNREAIIYYFDCMVRYSHKFFLSTLETQPNSIWGSNDLIPISLGPFRQRLTNKMGEVIVRSSMLSSAFTPYYHMDVTRFEGSRDLESYDLDSLVQCSPDLDPVNCTTCLKLALKYVTDCCSDRFWVMVFTPNCFLYFSITTSPLPPLPPPNISGSFSIRGSNEIFWGMTVAVSVVAFFCL